jgi:hypothetical protein
MFRPGKADLEWLQQRLDSVPLYLIQRFLERFDLPDRNQQILKLIGIRHFFYVLTGRGRQRRKMTFQSVPYSFLQLFNEFSFALSYARSHTLSPEFFFPRVKSFRIHGNRSPKNSHARMKTEACTSPPRKTQYTSRLGKDG